MNDRFKLGLLFNFNPKWTGGIIYLLNAIRILNFLEDKDKPKVVILYNPALKKYVDEIQYPYLELVPHNFSSIYKGYVDSILKNKNTFVHDLLGTLPLDVNSSKITIPKSAADNENGNISSV